MHVILRVECYGDYYGENCEEECDCDSDEQCHHIRGCVSKYIVTSDCSVMLSQLYYIVLLFHKLDKIN